jgi:methoxymalonate biosynthesis protein
LAEREGETAHLKLFCVSCRVESRGIAVVFLKSVIGLLQRGNPGLTRIECRYQAAERNRKVAVVLKMLGFSRLRSEGGGVIYGLKLPRAYRVPEYLEVREISKKPA